LPFCHSTLKAKKPKDSRYPSEIQTLGDHLRRRRLDLGLKQKEVARMLGVDEMTVNNWETNRRKPVVRFMPRIMEFLGYTPYMGPMSFAARLRMHRLEVGLSQRKLAMKLGVDESSVRNWEIGRVRPIQKSLRILDRFLRHGIS
jgi:transcriptional regulator with XRE-family HTH domain